MQRIRLNIFFRCFWVVLACHILNLSIDAPDARPDAVPEDLTFNDVESISELILENCLGLPNAVAEYDEPDTADGNSLDLKKVDFFFQAILPPPAPLCYVKILKIYLIQAQPFYNAQYFAVISPPPENDILHF